MSGPSTGAGFAAAVAGLLGVAIVLGLVLVADDPADVDLAPPAPPVLVEFDGQPIQGPAPMTCAELRAGRDAALRAAAGGSPLANDRKRGWTELALAYSAAIRDEECEP